VSQQKQAARLLTTSKMQPNDTLILLKYQSVFYKVVEINIVSYGSKLDKSETNDGHLFYLEL
jgi:hypothetical protein